MNYRALLVGAGALLLLGLGAEQARAQHWAPQLHQLHGLCMQGDRDACVRFGVLIGEHHERWVEWHRRHPDWWWWSH